MSDRFLAFFARLFCWALLLTERNRKVYTFAVIRPITTDFSDAQPFTDIRVEVVPDTWSVTASVRTRLQRRDGTTGSMQYGTLFEMRNGRLLHRDDWRDDV